MRAYTLPQALVKQFMGRILREDILDLFMVRSIELTLTTHISISGKLEAEDAEKKFLTWGEARRLAYDLIRRGTKPKLIKIVFAHAQPTEIHPNAAALFLNFSYENDGISLTTATAQREFALERSLDAAWDEWVQKYFAAMGATLQTHIPQPEDE